ncbi:MAG TPA: hypothetical protein VGR70_09920 [Stellaceae bacterium]|nr:hypothetical protein [Stellaceae bacterium]
MRLADLLSILKRDKSGLARAAELGERLVALEAERETIIAELAELGFSDAAPAPAGKPGAAIIREPDTTILEVFVPGSADLYETARKQIMAPQLEDFAKGIIDEDKLEKETLRRKDLIADRVRELRAGSSSDGCSQCAAAATTTIAGIAYCDEHAKSAPRPAPPRIAA